MNKLPRQLFIPSLILAAAVAIFFAGNTIYQIYGDSTPTIYRGSTSINSTDSPPPPASPEPNCPYQEEKRAVRGDSLSGLIENGATVKILFNYYKCRDPQRGDIIAYHYAAKTDPIIKIVKGVPGDTLGLKTQNGKWLILLNGEIVKNSKSEEYEIDGSGERMLSLYIKDYKGVIPEGAYLLLGNLKNGSLDSTRFGLVGKEDILGKVEQ